MSTPDQNDDESDRSDTADGRDYALDIPDECLGIIFHFLGSGDRKRSSLVCQRWLRVDGEHRHCLSLKAQAGILPFVPCIFARFDSVGTRSAAVAICSKSELRAVIVACQDHYCYLVFQCE